MRRAIETWRQAWRRAKRQQELNRYWQEQWRLAAEELEVVER